MKIDFVDDLESTRIEEVSTEIEMELDEAYPTVRHVYLDATASNREQRELARVVQELADADADGDPNAAHRLSELEQAHDRDAAAARERAG